MEEPTNNCPIDRNEIIEPPKTERLITQIENAFAAIASKICFESKQPIIILGGTNTFNNIQTQNTDQSAVNTIQSLIDEKRSEGKTKTIFAELTAETVKTIVEIGKNFMEERAKQKKNPKEAPKPANSSKNKSKAKRKK